MNKWIGLLVILLVSVTSHAAVYMQQDKDGDITYSDTSLGQGEQIVDENAVDVSTTTTQTASQPEKKVAGQDQAAVQTIYKVFSIASPTDGATIQNQTSLALDFTIDPELRAGDAIQVYLDGAAVGTPVKGKHIEVPWIDRGEHQVYAELIDQGRRVIAKTSTITVFYHRASKITSPAFKNGSN